MKKILAVVAFMVMVISSSHAQESNKLSVGLKVGYNYSNVYDQQGEKFNTDPKLGFAGGVFLTIPIASWFGLQPELLYSQRGFKATGMMLGNSYTIARTTNYIDLPLLAVFKPVSVLSIVAGPQFSYLLSQTDVFSNSVLTLQQEQQFNSDNIRKNTMCFVGGVDINLGPAVIGARVGWDILNNNGDGTSTTPRYKNTWLQGTIGLRF